MYGSSHATSARVSCNEHIWIVDCDDIMTMVYEAL